MKKEKKEEEPRIAKSISNRNSDRIPRLEMEKVKNDDAEENKIDLLLQKKLYEGMMPLIPEESFRFLKLDNPRLTS